MLSREEVRQKFVEWGIENPTNEQVADYLAQISKEIKSSEDRALKFRDEAQKVKELTKELDDLKSANLTDIERANKATEDALKEVESLKKTVKAMELSKSLAEINIVGDDASQLVNEDGSLNVSKLGEILKARETSAVSAFQDKILDETPSPQGGKPAEDEGDPLVKDVVQRFSAEAKATAKAADIVNSYK